MYAELKLLNH